MTAPDNADYRTRPAVYRDRRDWWVGYYRGDTHHYVCPLPTLVIRWPRAGVCACGAVDLLGGAVELSGVRHRLDGLCYRCDTYGQPLSANDGTVTP